MLPPQATLGESNVGGNLYRVKIIVSFSNLVSKLLDLKVGFSGLQEGGLRHRRVIKVNVGRVIISFAVRGVLDSRAQRVFLRAVLVVAFTVVFVRVSPELLLVFMTPRG